VNYFFAITLPDEAREQLTSFAKRWEQQIDPGLRARWCPPEDYHVTLKFLGGIAGDLVPLAVRQGEQSALQRNTYHPGPVTISQKPLAAFPGIVRPHVLWVEVAANDLLHSLIFGLDRSLETKGVKRDFRPYKPHITLARCNPTTDVPSFILEERAFDDFTVDHFHLMQTLPPEERAKGSKARYNSVHTFPLAGAQISDVS
jgi:2'-5' RNA ligase